MSTIYSTPTSLQMLEVDGARAEAQLAAAAFLARYSGRTLARNGPHRDRTGHILSPQGRDRRLRHAGAPLAWMPAGFVVAGGVAFGQAAG